MSTRILVGNLPTDATEESLKAFFAQIGPVKRIEMPANDRGQVKGFAYITFNSRAEAIDAKRLSDSEYKGRSLSVSLMKDEISEQKSGFFSIFKKRNS